MEKKQILIKPKNVAKNMHKVVLYNTPTTNENCQCCTVNMSGCK